MAGELVPIILFIVIGAVIALIAYFRSRARAQIQKTVRVALDKGQELTPEVLKSLTDSLSSPHGDLRRGVISIAIGVAFSLFAILLGEEDATGPLLAISAFPFLIGIAYLGLYFFLNKENDKSEVSADAQRHAVSAHSS